MRRNQVCQFWISWWQNLWEVCGEKARRRLYFDSNRNRTKESRELQMRYPNSKADFKILAKKAENSRIWMSGLKVSSNERELDSLYKFYCYISAEHRSLWFVGGCACVCCLYAFGFLTMYMLRFRVKIERANTNEIMRKGRWEDGILVKLMEETTSREYKY